MFKNFPAELPKLESARLILREITNEDLHIILPIVCYEGIYAKNINEGKILLQKLNKRFEEKTSLRWGIVLKEIDQMVGTCALKLLYTRTGEIEYIIMSEHRGKGIATEASSMMIDYGFKTLRIRNIDAYIYDVNKPSAAVVKKLNFVEVESDEEDQLKYSLKT